MSVLLQTAAITKMNIKSIPQRLWMSISTVVAVALVVAVLLGFLALSNGFQRTLEGTGRDDVALLLRAGSEGEINSIMSPDQLRLIAEGPGIERRGGTPLVSGELYVVVDGVRRTSGLKANMPLRGVGPEALAVRPGVSIIQGRMFSRGSNEIVVGRGLLEEFTGFEPGKSVRFGTSSWTIVGVFEADGSVVESELWADAPVVQSLFNRGNTIQTVRVKLTAPEQIKALETYVKNDPRLNVDISSEKSYFAEQAKSTGDIIRFLGWPLGILMALGALAGALNTMYAAVSARAGEIATLRTIGFGGLPTFLGTLVEALVLAMIGAALGVLLSWLFFDGLTTSTLGSSFTQIVFQFKLSGALIAQATILALVIGLIGGIFPAWRAARQRIIDVMGS
jgi:putative ABC transport system permease protein